MKLKVSNTLDGETDIMLNTIETKQVATGWVFQDLSIKINFIYFYLSLLVWQCCTVYS